MAVFRIIVINRWPLSKPVRARFRNDLGHTMPGIPRGARHVQGVSRSQLDRCCFVSVLITDEKKCIAANAEANKTSIAEFTDVTMDTEGVSRGVNIDNCCLCVHVRE